MNQNVNTTMREAFANITVKTGAKLDATADIILGSLKRGVGVKKRKTMWSMQRGTKRV
ncbi:hypothetical protein [Luteibacter sp. 22Crub2.1]|jgi:hypothetical protein|uniref:hypothetical protein n=1 Tax=Luteibacter sp. 22Crub2.1 TaxID=1283288 RepID=UPI0009D4C345|nr:hypothetical protein [Luteibacter sp. 22Crub2.1]SKB50381.1 hypothetical protein SAMN05660880_01348 [Luteibacter sp. 22Crub2.1]